MSIKLVHEFRTTKIIVKFIYSFSLQDIVTLLKEVECVVYNFIYMNMHMCLIAHYNHSKEVDRACE